MSPPSSMRIRCGAVRASKGCNLKGAGARIEPPNLPLHLPQPLSSDNLKVVLTGSIIIFSLGTSCDRSGGVHGPVQANAYFRKNYSRRRMLGSVRSRDHGLCRL